MSFAKRVTGVLTAATFGLVGLAACTPTPPAVQGQTVSADVLPTVQINGVVWSQATVGNTVYATGQFSFARPAGSPVGVNQTRRNNLLSYDITTGQLTHFAHGLNAAGQVAAVSPDGSRLYVGGDFTTVDGQVHNRIAAFNTATGALISTFTPAFNARVKAIAATNNIVYVGGSFTAVNGVARTKLAALNVNGGLLGWKPAAQNGNVLSMVVTPDLQKVVIGGSFDHINGSLAIGMGAVQSLSGVVQPWLANTKIHNSGVNSGITSLTTDGKAIYGTGFVFGGGGIQRIPLEGAFSANPSNGAVNWIEDCHGDTYDTYVLNSVVYAVSHAHFCGNIGGFPQTTPWTFYRATAFTTKATGTITTNTGGPTYWNWAGNPRPTLLNWFPTLTTGTFTGQMQAAWSVTGNGQYISLGGEFPTVNSAPQQGLVRFAVRALAPNKVGPRPSPGLTPTLAVSPGTIKLTWTSTFDQDDQPLTYKIYRSVGNAPVTATTPIYTLTANSTFWSRPVHTLTNTGLASGTKYNYRVFVYDPWGNLNAGATVSAVAG